jgi:hypothetical protein
MTRKIEKENKKDVGKSDEDADNRTEKNTYIIFSYNSYNEFHLTLVRYFCGSTIFKNALVAFWL